MTETPSRMTGTPDLGDQAVRDPYALVPQVLDLVRMTGAIFFRAEFRSPWTYTSPPTLELAGALPDGVGSLVMFHIISAGECWIRMADGVRRDLRRGDVVVMPCRTPTRTPGGRGSPLRRSRSPP